MMAILRDSHIFHLAAAIGVAPIVLELEDKIKRSSNKYPGK